MRPMSVHSLIDKFSNPTDQSFTTPRSKSEQPERYRGLLRLASPTKEPDASALTKPASATESWSRHNLSEEKHVPLSSDHTTRITQERDATQANMVPEHIAVHFLGPEVKQFSMSEQTFQEALRLRTEQQAAKNEEIRLQIASKNHSIIELALKNEVPPELIPYMCAGNTPTTFQGSRGPPMPAQFLRPRDSSIDLSRPIAPTNLLHLHYSDQRLPFLAPHPTDLSRDFENADNASAVNPVNYRFGGTPKFSQPTPSGRRPQSPAKIGAAAVANLANPVTPFRPMRRTLPVHQRHYSMPVEGLSAQRQPDRTTKSKGQSGSHPNAVLQSPLGSTSLMQVRPSPAQPLNKQVRNSQLPSQELMSSFQHIIQFHHWKPENPGEKPAERPEHRRGSSISSQSLSASHKRHKSNDMSIDMLHSDTSTVFQHQLAPPIDLLPTRSNEGDISMDTSDATITGEASEETNSRKLRQANSRFPRDILLSGD